MLDKIRERDIDCGVVIPEHWQAQQDRRFLLNMIDEQASLIVRLQFEVAELEHSAIKKENSQLRKALMDTNKQYVEVCNETLELKRKLEEK